MHMAPSATRGQEETALLFLTPSDSFEGATCDTRPRHTFMSTSATIGIDTSSCCRARNRWKHWWRDWGPANSDFWRLAQLCLSGGQRHGVPLLTECKETLTSTLVIFHPALMTQSKRDLLTLHFHGCVMSNWCLRYWHCLLEKNNSKKTKIEHCENKYIVSIVAQPSV